MQRLAGVDVARGTALLGMMAVHVYPSRSDLGDTTLVHHVFSGRASALFAVLAGVGLALLARSTPSAPRLLRSVAVRALLVALVGLGVGQAESGVAVILVYYGLLFLVALPLLRLGPRVLAALAVGSALVLPVVSFLLRPGLGDRVGENPSLSDLLDDPGGLLETLLVTGYYPVLCWTAYLCAGLAVGRLDLADRSVQVRLAAGGAGLAVAASAASSLLLGPLGGLERIEAVTEPRPGLTAAQTAAANQFGNVPTDTAWWLAVDAPHSSTPPDLLHTTGTALLVLGVALLVARGGAAPLRPLAAAGAMTLTLYAVHVLVLATSGEDRPGLLWGSQAVLFLGFAVLWLRAFRRGPLEAAVAGVARR